MVKKYTEEDGLEKLLEEQYIKEAEMLEEALFSDGDFEDYDASDEEVQASYEKLIARLKADGVYNGDEEEPESGKVVPLPEKKHAPRRHGRLARAACWILVCVLGVFAASMTSEANRRYVIRSWQYLTGGGEWVVNDNDEGNEAGTNRIDEHQAVKKIEDILGVEVPEFFYRPRYLEFCDYNIDADAGIARMKYKYRDSIVVLFISIPNVGISSNITGIHGDNVETVFTIRENLKVDIEEIEDEQEDFPSYSAKWERNNVIYHLSGKMEKEEFKKMIQDIMY